MPCMGSNLKGKVRVHGKYSKLVGGNLQRANEGKWIDWAEGVRLKIA